MPQSDYSYRNCICKSLLFVAKFTYGYLFGHLIWWILIQPYEQYSNLFSLDIATIPKVIFTFGIAVSFLLCERFRVVSLLFLPSMFAQATQNYVTIAILVLLFSNPIYNVAINASESVRVIGCSLFMVYEQLREQAKLILSPVLELLKTSRNPVNDPIQDSLVSMEQMVLELKRDADLADSESAAAAEAAQQRVKEYMLNLPSVAQSFKEMKQQLKQQIDSQSQINKPDSKPKNVNISEDLAQQTRELMRNISLKLDDEKKQVKIVANVDFKRLMNERLVKAKNLTGKLEKQGDIELSQLLFDSCITIFQRAKLVCSETAEQIRQECTNHLGAFLSTLWCSPVTFTVKALCPHVMDQIVDEKKYCEEFQAKTKSIRLDPFNLTAKGDQVAGIDETYSKLRKQILLMANESINKSESNQELFGRQFELRLSLNEATANIFFKAKAMVQFLLDKYRMRMAIYRLMLLIYDIYTSITFIIIIRHAANYRKSYLSSIRFDNYYITGQFLRLDEQRKAQKKRNVLPLTRDESKRFIEGTFTCRRRTEEEQQVQASSCSVFIICIAICLSLLYFDSIFYSILKSIQEHARMQISEIGRHRFVIDIKGDGMIARTVSKLTSRLNSIYSMARYSDTKKCLPIPSETPSTVYLNLLYLFVVYCLIDQLSIYAMRLRRLTAAMFYPQKERERIRFLYNLILLSRQTNEQLGLNDEMRLIEGKGSKSERNEDEDLFTMREAILYLANCLSLGLNKLIVRTGIYRSIERIGPACFGRHAPRMFHNIVH